ncbi:MAG: 50S ribosomal protein L29 [Acidimicrobiia bacterium]|nr:50S ribosomal protein L29 [Acidimicrobiia bacterium]
MKASDFREMSDTELINKLSESKEELFNLRIQLATGQLESFNRITELRRDVARCHTLLRQREIALAEENQS